MNDMKLVELRNKKAELEGQLKRVNDEIFALICEAQPVRIGDVVEQRGKVYKVSRFRPYYDDTSVRVYGLQRRKNGSFGVERELWSLDGPIVKVSEAK